MCLLSTSEYQLLIQLVSFFFFGTASEKSLEKETRYNHEYKPNSYFDGTSYDQAESYNEQSKGYDHRTG